MVGMMPAEGGEGAAPEPPLTHQRMAERPGGDSSSAPTITASSERATKSSSPGDGSRAAAGMVEAVEQRYLYPCFTAFYQKTGFGRRLLAPCGCLPVFNICVLITLALFFMFNAYSITSAYIESQDNPPASISVPDRGGTLDLPSMIFCNSQRDAPLDAVSMTYVGLDETEVPTAPTSYVGLYNNATYRCQAVNSTGLRASILGAQGGLGAIGVGYINAVLDINSRGSNTTDLFVGVRAFLYHDGTDKLGDEASTADLAMLQADGYVVLGAGVFTSVTLSLTKTTEYDVERREHAEPYFQYNINSGNARINPGHPFLADGKSLDSKVVASFAFATTQVVEIKQQPQNFSTFFGSLAGWVGSCSDGWGALTLL